MEAFVPKPAIRVAGNHHFLTFMLLMEGDESQDTA
jgi:hypothetical protein